MSMYDSMSMIVSGLEAWGERWSFWNTRCRRRMRRNAPKAPAPFPLYSESDGLMHVPTTCHQLHQTSTVQFSFEKTLVCKPQAVAVQVSNEDTSELGWEAGQDDEPKMKVQQPDMQVLVSGVLRGSPYVV